MAGAENRTSPELTSADGQNAQLRGHWARLRTRGPPRPTSDVKLRRNAGSSGAVIGRPSSQADGEQHTSDAQVPDPGQPRPLPFPPMPIPEVPTRMTLNGMILRSQRGRNGLLRHGGCGLALSADRAKAAGTQPVDGRCDGINGLRGLARGGRESKPPNLPKAGCYDTMLARNVLSSKKRRSSQNEDVRRARPVR
jgi:hypothetical protein